MILRRNTSDALPARQAPRCCGTQLWRLRIRPLPAVALPEGPSGLRPACPKAVQTEGQLQRGTAPPTEQAPASVDPSEALQPLQVLQVTTLDLEVRQCAAVATGLHTVPF